MRWTPKPKQKSPTCLVTHLFEPFVSLSSQEAGLQSGFVSLNVGVFSPCCRFIEKFCLITLTVLYYSYVIRVGSLKIQIIFFCAVFVCIHLNNYIAETNRTFVGIYLPRSSLSNRRICPSNLLLSLFVKACRNDFSPFLYLIFYTLKKNLQQ